MCLNFESTGSYYGQPRTIATARETVYFRALAWNFLPGILHSSTVSESAMTV